MVSALAFVALISSTTFAQERPMILTTPAPATQMANPSMLGGGIALATVGLIASAGGVAVLVMTSHPTPSCTGDLCTDNSSRLVPFAVASLGMGLTALIPGAIIIAEGSKPTPITESSIPLRWTF